MVATSIVVVVCMRFFLCALILSLQHSIFRSCEIVRKRSDVLRYSGKKLSNPGKIGYNLLKIINIIFATVWLFAGCASSQVDAMAGDSHEAEQVFTPDSLHKYPPLQRAELPNRIDDGPIFYASPPTFDSNPLPLPEWIDVGSDSARSLPVRLVEGYRIQLYAGRDKLQAKRIELDALNRSNLSVYLNYEAPQYKVRVGNFSDREQAVQDCNRLKQLGFTESWVVRTTILAQ